MDPLQLLERLLAATERTKCWLDPADRKAWDEVSAATADLREQADEAKRINVGDRVRSYDFTWPVLREDCYVEGIVEKIGRVTGGGDIDRYSIRCTRRVMSGQDVAPEDAVFVPPVNGTPKLTGGVCDGVRKLPKEQS